MQDHNNQTTPQPAAAATTTTAPTTVVPFSDNATPQTRHCAEHQCTAGHRWAVKLAIAVCAGCGQPTIAMLREMCPYCNEPIAHTRLRVDSVSRGGGIAKICQSEPTSADVHEIKLTMLAEPATTEVQ